MVVHNSMVAYNGIGNNDIAQLFTKDVFFNSFFNSIAIIDGELGDPMVVL